MAGKRIRLEIAPQNAEAYDDMALLASGESTLGELMRASTAYCPTPLDKALLARPLGDFFLTAIAPEPEDLFLPYMVAEGPDGGSFELINLEASMPIGDLAREVLGHYERNLVKPNRPVVDLHLENGTRRLSPDQTLFETGLRVGDRISVSSESEAGGATKSDEETPRGGLDRSEREVPSSTPPEEQADGNSPNEMATERLDNLPGRPNRQPASINEGDAVRLAYTPEIDQAASFLQANLSVLIYCDKLVVEYLWPEIARRAALRPAVLEVPEEDGGIAGMMPRSLRQRQLSLLKTLVKSLKMGDVLIVRHLDLLASGGESSLSNDTRELTEIIYEDSDRLILAFADRTLELPEVLASRFAVRFLVSGVPRMVTYPDGRQASVGEALITSEEAAVFRDFDPETLYKHIAGLNPVRLRHGIRYAVKEHAGKDASAELLFRSLRAFKAQSSAKFEVPDVGFEDIGGYAHVKAELARAIRLMMGSYNLPHESLRSEMIPRGFIFYGPPGTGKTLFAKAIANKLNATILIVSGPEVTDMYVGESERKLRDLFAEARNNAPSVLVFDEFDAIAGKRSGRDDGGSRAGNAMVAQILTEMDGFRPEVPMLVIGTTNRLDIIDEALLRPSRFKPIAIDLPDPVARKAIARVHADHFRVDVSETLLDLIAHFTVGMNGDEIRSLFRDASVGLYCEDPPIEADAQRFGTLVGRLRRGAESRQETSSEQRQSVLLTVPRGRRPTPSGAMVSLTGEAGETDATPPATDTRTTDETDPNAGVDP